MKRKLLRQIDKHHLVSRKFFSSMQEITLYFLRQSRLHFMLIGNSKPIKSQVKTDITKTVIAFSLWRAIFCICDF